jgi:5-carboxymethyl-2-hydroxymuconate isomerase
MLDEQRSKTFHDDCREELMPHIVAEYSNNLADRIDIGELLQTLHQAALASGVFPIGGLRTRAAVRDHYLIADAHPDNAFIQVSVRIGHGRDEQTKRRVGDQLFSALCAYLEPTFKASPLSIGLEIQEIDPLLNFKQNNLHDLVKQRRATQE